MRTKTEWANFQNCNLIFLNINIPNLKYLNLWCIYTYTLLNCDVFTPIHCCIYPYLIEYLYLTYIPMLLILFHTSSSLCSEVFTPIHCCIYPYLIEYLYLTCIPMLLIFFHTSSSLCSEEFIPIHCCIYRCLIEYLYLCDVKLQKKEVFIKK